MATINYSKIINHSKEYFPEDVHNMSYDETVYYLYGIDIDYKESEKK